MKSLFRIQKAVYESPWMVLPSVHESIRSQLENILSGKVQMPMDPEEDPEDPEEPMDMPMEQNSSTAIICIDGIIGKHLSMMEVECGGVDLDTVSEELDTAMEDANVKNIILYINSPGGTVSGVPELAQKIADISTKKNCIAYVDMLCASAGYYLASQCSAIYAAPSADLGSVGVYSLYMDQSVALANEGIKVNAISAGKYKLTGAPFRPMTDEERAMLQADIDKIYNQFKGAVTSKRTIKDEDLQGQCFSGEDLITKGFIDGYVNSLKELVTAFGQLE